MSAKQGFENLFSTVLLSKLDSFFFGGSVYASTKQIKWTYQFPILIGIPCKGHCSNWMNFIGNYYWTFWLAKNFCPFFRPMIYTIHHHFVKLEKKPSSHTLCKCFQRFCKNFIQHYSKDYLLKSNLLQSWESLRSQNERKASRYW